MADLSDWLQLAQAIQPWPGAAESIAFETKMGDFDRLLQP